MFIDKFNHKVNNSEQILRWLGMVTESSDEGIAITDINGQLLLANRSFAAMHGHNTTEELKGRNICSFHNDSQVHSDLIPLLNEVIEMGSLSGPIEHIRADGHSFQTTTKIALLKNNLGHHEGFIFFVRDNHQRYSTARERLLDQNMRLKTTGENSFRRKLMSRPKKIHLLEKHKTDISRQLDEHKVNLFVSEELNEVKNSPVQTFKK